MSSRVFHLGTAAALVLCLATSAAAQQNPPRQPAPAPQASGTNTPTYELSAGYQLLHVPDQTFPFGVNVDAARHFGSLGLVGEVGWARDSEELGGGDDISADVFHYAVGGRWTGFGSGKMWPFVQLLVGGETLRASTEIGDVDVSDTESSFLLQPGVGVTFVAGDGWGIVGQVDYRRTFFDEPDDIDEEDSVNNQFRVYVGVKMILD